MPFKHVIPTHQGRAAEHILTSIVADGHGKGKIVPNNTHFDTTQANFEDAGIDARDLVIAEGLDTALEHPFKGNMDLDKLEKLLAAEADNIPMVETTITNNAGGGQPVSMANIRGTKAICEKYNKPLIIDSARFAENAYFIKLREEGFPTYGCLNGREMECMAIGLKEIIDEDYLQYRIRSISYINNGLDALGVPVMKPSGTLPPN